MVRIRDLICFQVFPVFSKAFKKDCVLNNLENRIK